MSADRLLAPASQVEVIEGALRRARLAERLRCANIASQYPVFAYDGDTGELLRLRDAISESILKGGSPGEMIK